MSKKVVVWRITIALALVALFTHPSVSAGVEEEDAITCYSKKGVFIVPLYKITHLMRGVNDNSNCISAVDTVGTVHVICNTDDEEYKCYLSTSIEV